MNKNEDSTTEDNSSLLNEIVNKLATKSTADTSPKDFMFILIIVFMIEDGFVLLNEDYEVVDIRTNIIEKSLYAWRKEAGIYEALLAYSKFIDTPVKLIVSPLGSTVIINVIVIVTSDTFSLGVPISRYVICSEASTVSKMFCDLQHLKSIFKDKILSSVKSIIFDQHGYASASLSGLPEELLIKILLYLNISDIVNVSKTCSKLKISIDNEVIWSKLCRRDHKNSNHIQSNYKEHYIDTYVTLKKDPVMPRYVQYIDCFNYSMFE